MSKAFDAPKLMAQVLDCGTTLANQRDAILYALGVGVSVDPLDEWGRAYTYQFSDRFLVFPDYATTFLKKNSIDFLMQSPHMRAFDPLKILHAEFRTEFLRPVQLDQKYRAQCRLLAIEDKTKFSLFTFQYDVTTEEKGSVVPVGKFTSTLLMMGETGFGNHGSFKSQFRGLPKTEPARQFSTRINPAQAIIHRLSGDLNPIHIDPKKVKALGFDRPILHGICSSGIVLRVLLKEIFSSPEDVLAHHVRYVGHVFPGETLQVRLWELGDGQFAYEASTKQRGKTVLLGNVQAKKAQKASL